jgi:Tol biopolymer transport system component
LPAAPANVAKVERVSVSTAGTQGDGASTYCAVSGDGRFVAFLSAADNLVAGDTNGHVDVFVRDRQLGTTERVSVSTAGAQADADCLGPAISADGRFVVFSSAATTLVPADTNGKLDVFVHDRQTGITERVSVSSAGVQGDNNSAFPSISGDGRFVAFWSAATNLVSGDTNAHSDVFVHDRQTGVTERVSVSSAGVQADGDSLVSPAISADGRFVAFYSSATNLVPGDTNAQADVFVGDRQLGTTERVSVSSAGA